MSKPSAPTQEWVCVPREPSDEMIERGIARYDAEWPVPACREVFQDMLAAAPDSGHVGVPRELLERAVDDLERMCDAADLMPDHIAETISMLRALLSRAGNKGDGR